MQLLVVVVKSSGELYLIITDHDNRSVQGQVILSSAALRKLLSLQFTLVPLPIFRHSVT
jgi:hypothetical protein